MLMKLQLLILCYILLSCLNLSGQSANLITTENPKFLTKLYYDSLEANQAIYKGIEYIYYAHKFDGNPYFFSGDMTNCEVIYEDFVYDSIQAYYDIFKQLLIIKHDELPFHIALDSKKISQFKIHGHVFEKLYLDSIPGMTNGYYDKRVDKKVKFYVQREKEIEEEVANQFIRKWFVVSNKYYIFKDGIYHRVRGKGSVLKVLADHKKELKAYIRNNSISFTTFPEDGIKKIVEYYNELSK